MCDKKWPESTGMRQTHFHAKAFVRARRASTGGTDKPAKRPGMRTGRRGNHNVLNAVWRRGVPGENKISCYGQWRQGARRQAARINRDGETRWHRPYKAQSAPNQLNSGTINEP